MFQELSSLLSNNIQRKGLRYQVEAARVLTIFDETIEELWLGQMRDRVKALYIKDHTLTVAVLSPLLAQELRRRQDDIIQTINGRLGVEAIYNLRFMS